MSKSLSDWLLYTQSLHVKEIDLSLERVTLMVERLKIIPPCPVITVAGTNGKGSCVAGLESIYREAGYKTGTFTSPFLFKYNEQVRILGKEVTDEEFCKAFEKVDATRGEVTLTPFEFNTLVAFNILKESDLDVWILEVGLGGRWDAVNAVDADVALVTSISIDHVEWLGNTREKIAYEKAGVFRPNHPAICGDFDPPSSLREYASQLEAPLYCQNEQFSFEEKGESWNWGCETKKLIDLPITSLALQNMSTVLMAVELLQEKLPVSDRQIKAALTKVTLAGRIQVVERKVTHIFDVSHNPASAEFLSIWLAKHPINGKTRAVFSMLADKDAFETIQVIKKQIDDWYIAPLLIKRAAPVEKLLECFTKAEIQTKRFQTISEAYDAVLEETLSHDRIIIFGSFHTVAEVGLHINI